MTGRPRLAARRQSCGLTQESLAARLGVERTTVARWEHGTSHPQPHTRCQLADALGLSSSELDGMLSGGVESDRPVRLAICGSRAAGTVAGAIDSAVAALALLVVTTRPLVNHGPVGVGIEVMTYVADRYRPAHLTMTTTLFGRQQIVSGVDYVLVVGGGRGTADEIELAASMEIPILPFPHSGGTAAAAYTHLHHQAQLTRWMHQDSAVQLGAAQTGDHYVAALRRILNESDELVP